MKILIVDEDLNFILELQKLFPQDVEWLALDKVDQLQHLMAKQSFDYIISRKRNEAQLRDILQKSMQNADVLASWFKKIIILPNLYWKAALKKQPV